MIAVLPLWFRGNREVVYMWQWGDVILLSEGQTGAGSAVVPQHVMQLCGNTSIKCSLLHSYVSDFEVLPITLIYPEYNKVKAREVGMAFVYCVKKMT